MGRKKRPVDEAPREGSKKSKKVKDPYDSSDEEPRERRHYDIDPEIQELAYTYNIDDGLTQRLNDIMIEERQRTWEQDLARLYEILKDAHTPAAMLNLKVRDMEKGTFLGKAKCGPQVQELARKHRLDKGASTKLEEAMSAREAMGKNVEKDLMLLDEHLQASNKPSALVSMKLETLRKGYSIGHCIYSREAPVPGNQAPGVDGVFDKRGKRSLGYTDADLDKRFAEAASSSGPGGGALMDEAAARRMIAQERELMQASRAAEVSHSRSRSPSKKKKSKAKDADKEKDKDKDRGRDKDKEREKEKDRDKDRDRDRGKEKEKEKEKEAKKRRKASGSSPGRSLSRSRQRSSVKAKKSRSRSRRKSSSRKRGR